jgi:transposase-like protein
MTKSPIDDLLSEQLQHASIDLSSECPRCHATNIVRSGHAKGRQRYQCESCHYHYTVRQRGKSPAFKRMALHLYLEGSGFRAIGRLLGVSNVAVMNWIYQFGDSLAPIRKPEGSDLEIVEIDEMFTYIQQKKNLVGSGSLWIGLDTGSSASCWVRDSHAQESDSGNS